MGAFIYLSSILRKTDTGKIAFECPGCGCPHILAVQGPDYVKIAREDAWTWNNDTLKPTFSPSVLVTWHGRDNKERRCHSFVRDGMIEFLTDSTHEFSGQTVPIPLWDTKGSDDV